MNRLRKATNALLGREADPSPPKERPSDRETSPYDGIEIPKTGHYTIDAGGMIEECFDLIARHRMDWDTDFLFNMQSRIRHHEALSLKQLASILKVTNAIRAKAYYKRQQQADPEANAPWPDGGDAPHYY